MRYLYILLIAVLLVGTQPLGMAQAGPTSVNILAAPTSVTVVGNLQSELGCAGDWQPDCAATNLAYDAVEGVWQGTFTVPAGNWEYKAAMNGTWDESYGQNTGPNNIHLILGSETVVKFYFSYETKWITDNVNSVIATAVGNFQSELGCPGDWQPDCLRSWMQDPDGDGIYTFSTNAIPAGNYEGKVALNETWDVSYPGGDLNFSVADGDTVTFTYNSTNNNVDISVTGAGASLDNTIWWNDLGHDSRDPLYRNPGGAVTTGTPVTLRLRAASGDLELARVRVWNDRTDTQAIYNMAKVASNIALPNDPGPYEFWEVTLPPSADPTVYWYRFIVKDGTATAYYEDDDARTGGWGQTFSESQDNSYQLSIYDPDFTTPDWVKNAVIYQIFPDRFRDGDSSNNPAAGEFFYGNNDTIYRSNGTDWNTPICDPRENFGGAMDCEGGWSQNLYGGDLRGIIEKLDYIADLGVTAIYLNPIFESPSNHKYDTADFGKIDPHFGTLADFEELVHEANVRNIHIILDGVFNHVSSDSPYMDRYSRYPEVGACESETSPYRGWFYFTAVTPGTGPCVGDDGTPNAADYESWWGYDSLPKLRANSNEVRQLIWDSNAPSTTEGIAAYWIGKGAKGWRLDVAGDIDPGTTSDPTNDYWEGFRDALHVIDPDAYIVGEEWGNAISWTLGGEWDASMNYQMSSAILSFWRDTPYSDNDFNAGSSAGPLNPIKAGALNDRLLNLQERYPPEAFAAMMNLFGSHDTNRPLFLLDHNADQEDVSLYLNPNYDWSDSVTRLMGAALIQMTMPGAPTIYYGDEIGLVGPVSFDGSQWQDDPYNRQPYPWLDETGTPYYAHLQTATGLRGDLLDYYKTLTGTRNTVPALRTGSFDSLWTDAASNIYAYGRKMADDSSAAIVVANKANSTGSVTLDVSGYLPFGAILSDALSAAGFTVSGAGELEITNIPSRGGYLLILDSGFAGSRPDAPVIAATPDGGEKVTVSWAAVTGASEYTVYRSPLSGGGYEEIGTTAGTSFDDLTVQPGTRYYYVARAIAANGLVSELSNEESALPAYTIGWANLQWPGTINPHTRSLVTPTENIYGQVWIDGVSGGLNAIDPTPGLVAQVGYGNDGSLPTDTSWIWFDAAFNGNVGNNDEFVGQMIVEAAPGTYDYLYRYSTDGGETWVYGAFNDTFYANLGSYNSANAGKMTVEASADIAAPAAPTNLAVTGTTTDSISLAWDAHPDDDGDLYGFEIWRKDLTASELSFTRAALLAGPGLTAYTDSTATADHEYEYYITAIDESVNASPASNTVTATAEMRYVEVTFRVTVPDPTPGTVYIAGGLPSPYPSWNPGGVALAETATPGIWEVILDILDGTSVEYKYTRGSWDTVEKGPAHEELGNRNVNVSYGANGEQLVENTIDNWRDPVVTSVVPADGATEVPANATISATWNQPMADPINPASCFSVSGPGGNVTGTVAYDVAEVKYTFTPDSDLADGEYTVTISDCKDAHNDTQQVPQVWSFEVQAPVSNQAPTDILLSNSTVAENQPAGTVVGIFSTTDPNASDTFSYSLVTGLGDADNNKFIIDTDILKTAEPFNHLAQNTLTIRLRTTDSGGLFLEKVFTITVTEQGPFFSDIDGHWAESFIKRLAGAGIASGFPDGTYRPGAPVTRGQMAVFLLKAMNYPASYTPPPASATFPDTADHWAEDWIEALKDAGLTSGYPDGTYKPDGPLSRAEMAIFLLKAINGPGYAPPAATPTFDDVAGHWASDWIEALRAAGLTSGYNDGTFRPDQAVTRAEMAVFIVNAFGLP